jgi:hypothetical protein
MMKPAPPPHCAPHHGAGHHLGALALPAEGLLGHVVGEDGVARRVVEGDADVAARGEQHGHARLGLGLHPGRSGTRCV